MRLPKMRYFGLTCANLYGTSLVVSSTFDTSTINTSTSLPSFVSTPIVTHSPTFDYILDQPITSIFCSQSTNPLITYKEVQIPTDDDEDVFDGPFADIQFDQEEEDIPNNMLLIGKQFKILNQKLNSLLQVQADGGKHSISSLEVDMLLKHQENRLSEAIQDVDRNNETMVKNQSSTFACDLKELKAVAKERHILFVQDVKKVWEYVNLKLQELRKDIALGPKVEKMSVDDVTSFSNINQLLEGASPIVSANQSLTNKCPTCCHRGARGERRHVGKGEGASGKTEEEEVKVVGKVFASHVPTPKPTFSNSDPVIATATTTRPITKGIAIGTTGEGSSSKPIPTITNQDRGKCIIMEKSKEERNTEKKRGGTRVCEIKKKAVTLRVYPKEEKEKDQTKRWNQGEELVEGSGVESSRLPRVLRICMVGLGASEWGSGVANVSHRLDEMSKGDRAWPMCPNGFGYGGSVLANVS
ncbi:unnamed protein product [Lactuca saligna]|uniref:Uncharacterized protein n=1 Tax=Lactuca saligna TaxID=75948 RepID=A0AA35Z5P2_LACSI|nr:unnamed protein product [Lactuca saligna]